MIDDSPPVLTIVVPFVNDPSDLTFCLDSLAGEAACHRLEVVVVDRRGTASEAVPTASRWIRILPAPPTASIPQMRAMAFSAALAPWVAVIEDHIAVPSGWVAEILAARAEGAVVVGGAIENSAGERLVDWAAFWCEYGRLAPPVRGGPTEILPGNNTGYDRAVLEKYLGLVAAGGWENRLHAAMRRDGIVLLSRPTLVVHHRMRYTVWLYTSQRYLVSRAFGADRAAGAPFATRFAMGLAAIALPPLLIGRIVSTVVRKSDERLRLVFSLPLLAWFAAVWAAGEVVGFWFGPGDAASRVR